MADVLFLIRHGEIPEEYAHRYIGRTDPSLAVSGRAACARLGELTCDLVYTSPLRRARETARLVNAPLRVAFALREIDFGDWENLTYDEISGRADPAQLRHWMEHPEAMVFPRGEAVPDFHRRVDRVFARIAAQNESRIAVVTHGGVLMRVLSVIGGIPPERQFECLPPRGGLVTIRRNNEVWHVG